MSVAALDNQNMSAASLDHLALDMVLPWHEQQEQQEKFKRLVKRIIIPVFAFMFVMSVAPYFFEDDEVEEKVVTKVILEPPKVVETPPPPPTEVKQQKTQSVKKDAKPKEGANTSLQNIAALSQQMSALRNSVNASKQQKKNVHVSESGKVQQSSRSRLGQNSMNSSSGGLKASDITVNAKGAAMAAHVSDDIESPLMNIELPDAAQYHYDPKKDSKRDMQSIRRTVERFKGTVYSLYAKALRLNPNLGGRFIFEFVILPSGAIENLKLISSELGNAQLEQQMLQKIKGMHFGAEDLSPTKVQYTYSFLPS
ncbi:MAG: AgmX/PglI C-terminal domain-containing protein [Gammaproteobacteria bacterium]|nr:AgmX/PglI C-terminal domain-containing protein [Gammaproteobacteria bacterium]